MLGITLYSKGIHIKESYFRLRDILAAIALDVKHSNLEFVKSEPEKSYIHPVNYNRVVLDGVDIGYIGMTHPTVSKNIDKKGNVVFAEIDINKFSSVPAKAIEYVEPSRYPSMEYDLSLDIPQGVMFSDLRASWKDAGTELLRNVSVIDTYDTDDVHRITVRFEFGSNERTLSSNEVQEIVDRITENLAKTGVTIKAQ